MSLLPFIDYHVHTELCHHAIGTMEEYVLTAIDKGLKKFYFLEHLETEIHAFRPTWLTDDDFAFYFQEGRRLQSRYGSQIEIGLGCEVGFNPDCEEQILTRIARYSFDWIGLSYHFHRVVSDDVYYNLVGKHDQRVLSLQKADAEKTIFSYFLHLNRAIDVIPCNMLCHLDAVLRYHPDIHNLSLPWPLIEELLQKMAEKHIALEINTSGLRLRGETFPCKEIIHKASLLGISLITGSDAHRPEHIAYAFDQLVMPSQTFL